MDALPQAPTQLPQIPSGRRAGPVDPEAFCIAPASLGEQIDFRILFGNQRTVELDIGSGKGLFLLHEAVRRPDVNFLGFEWAKKFARRAAERLARHDVSNVRIVVGDVRPILGKLRPAAVRAVHVYFPDPWWKRRHRKRRLFSGGFVGQIARILAPAGQLHLATDVEEYFGVMLAELERHRCFSRLENPQLSAPQHDLDYLTHFERKYRKQGRDIFRAIFARTEDDRIDPSAQVLPASDERTSR